MKIHDISFVLLLSTNDILQTYVKMLYYKNLSELQNSINNMRLDLVEIHCYLPKIAQRNILVQAISVRS